ncbi:cell wall hydrolase [Inquilinus limosus]|uniref:cell wall hydrolase n=1 Tax=Inquilinus limosus TaxID=171674 RepID=UPI003F186ADF
MTSKGLLLLSIALTGAIVLGGAIAIDSARPSSPPVVAVDLAGIAVEPARLLDPAEAARPQPAVATSRRLAETAPPPPAPAPDPSPLQVLFGSAFAAAPLAAEPSQAPLDPWAGALQEVTRPAPQPQEAAPVLVPVRLPGPDAEAERIDTPARLAEPLASALALAPVVPVVPGTAEPAQVQPDAVQPASGPAMVETDAVDPMLPSASGTVPVWARPRSSLLRVDRPEPETMERLDVALARAVSLLEPAGVPWLRGAEADGAGRRLTGCGPGDLACTIFVSGRGAALDQPSPLLRRHGAQPLSIGGVPLPAGPEEAERALRCLAFTAYAEAGNQGTRGMAAVIWVVMNRIAVANDFGDSPCEVLADPGQFEPLQRPRFRAFAKAVRGGGMPKFPSPLSAQDEILQRTARLVVWQMLDGYFADDPTDGAQYFLAPAAMRALGRGMPAWTNRFRRTAAIGDHVFYRPKRGG